MEAFIDSFISSPLGISILSFISVNLAEILGLIIVIAKNGITRARSEAKIQAKYEKHIKELKDLYEQYASKTSVQIDTLDRKVSAKIDESDLRKIEEVRTKQLAVEEHLKEVKHKLSIDEIIKN